MYEYFKYMQLFSTKQSIVLVPHIIMWQNAKRKLCIIYARILILKELDSRYTP